MLRLTPLSMFQVFRIALPSLGIPSTSVALQCHFPLNPTAGSPDLAIKRHAPTTGGSPAPLQIGERGNRFCETARDQRALPDRNTVSHLCRDLRGHADAMSRRPERKIIARTRTPKSIPPRDAGALGGWLQQRSGVQTQFWSVVFIGDSLLQVNQNCRGQGVDAVELSTNASGRVCWKSHPR